MTVITIPVGVCTRISDNNYALVTSGLPATNFSSFVFGCFDASCTACRRGLSTPQVCMGDRMARFGGASLALFAAAQDICMGGSSTSAAVGEAISVIEYYPAGSGCLAASSTKLIVRYFPEPSATHSCVKNNFTNTFFEIYIISLLPHQINYGGGYECQVQTSPSRCDGNCSLLDGIERQQCKVRETPGYDLLVSLTHEAPVCVVQASFENSSSSDPNIGAIVGGVIGILVALVAIFVVLTYFRRKALRAHPNKSSQHETTGLLATPAGGSSITTTESYKTTDEKDNANL